MGSKRDRETYSPFRAIRESGPPKVSQDDDDYWDRFVGIEEARQSGNIAFLLDNLNDQRLAPPAVRVLGALHATEAAPRLLMLLDSDSARVRQAGAKVLGDLGHLAAVDRLGDISTSDPAPNVRRWALESLAVLEGPAALPRLIPALEDPDWRVRAAAVVWLGRSGDGSALVPLENARRAERWRWRRLYRKAARAIRERSASQ